MTTHTTAIASIRSFAIANGATAAALATGFQYARNDAAWLRELCCRFQVRVPLEIPLLAVLCHARAAACEVAIERGIDALATTARAQLASEIWECTGLAPLPRPSREARRSWAIRIAEMAADDEARAIVDGAALEPGSRHAVRAAHARVRSMEHRAAAR